jgi:hypothetical protein
MNQDTFIFLHISKTAGTSMRSVIQRQYPAETFFDLDPSYFVSDSSRYEEVIKQRVALLRSMSDEEKRRIRYIIYSTTFGVHQLLPQPCVYMTMLRDPIDHFISSYYFAVNNTAHIRHHEIMEKNITLETYLDHFERDANKQARTLCGYDEIDQSYSVTIPLPTSALQMAKENLKKIAVVGITERFDESLLLMQDAFGWRDIRYERKNVAPKRLQLDQLSPALRERLQTTLAPDLELYAYAKSLFEERIAQYNPQGWQRRLIRLQQQNEQYSRNLKLKNDANRAVVRVLRSLGLRR